VWDRLRGEKHKEKAMNIVRTDEEIRTEIETLEKLKKKVKKYNNARDPNRKIIEAEIHFLKYGVYIHKKSWFYTPYSKQNLKDWLTNRDEMACSELWYCAC
jgi:hypothetical protein